MSLPLGASEGISGIVTIKSPTSAASSTSFFTSVQGVLFSEVVSRRSSGASRCRFSTASFVHPPAFDQIILVGEEVTAPDGASREVPCNVRYQFLRILARLLLSVNPYPKLTAECIGKLVLSARAKQQRRYVHFDVGTGPQACGETQNALPTSSHLHFSCHAQLHDQV